MVLQSLTVVVGIPDDAARTRASGFLGRRALLIALLLAVSVQVARADEATAVLTEIRFSGLAALSHADLEPVLSTKLRPGWRFWQPRTTLDERALAEDARRIVELYRERGYYEARASYTLEWSAERDAAAAEIAIEEGAPVVLESWQVDRSELPEGKGRLGPMLLEGLPLRSGEIFTLANYGGAKRMLLERLANTGYPDASISGGGSVDLETHQAVVRWVLHPGERLRFGPVRIEGLERVDEALVRQEILIREGGIYSEARLLETRQLVSDLGLFRSVVITPVVEADESAPLRDSKERRIREIELRVEERPARSVRFGIGYGTEDRIRVQAGWMHRNVFGRADRFEIKGRYSSLASEFDAVLREPRVLDRTTALELGVRLRNQTTPAFDAVELRPSLALERKLRRGWSWRAAYNVEWTRVTKVPGEAEAELDDPESRFLLSYLELGVRRITTDDLVEPTRGTWLEFSLEPATSVLRSDVSYMKWTADARGFLPIAGVVLAGRVVVGTIDPIGNSGVEDLPVTKLFFAGGSGSVRGYGYQRLGPTDAEDNPLGGASLLLGSTELRFPIADALRGVIFADAGQISVDPWDWQPGELLYAAGPGLRYSTPFGPIRLDVGFPLNPPKGTTRVRAWLSIGQAF